MVNFVLFNRYLKKIIIIFVLLFFIVSTYVVIRIVFLEYKYGEYVEIDGRQVKRDLFVIIFKGDGIYILYNYNGSYEAMLVTISSDKKFNVKSSVEDFCSSKKNCLSFYSENGLICTIHPIDHDVSECYFNNYVISGAFVRHPGLYRYYCKQFSYFYEEMEGQYIDFCSEDFIKRMTTKIDPVVK